MRMTLCIATAVAVFSSCVLADLHDDLDDALESGEMDTAVHLASKIVKKAPDDYDANFALALDCEAKEQFKEMAEHLKRCLRERPDDTVALNNLAMACLNLGDIKKAEKLAKKAAANAPRAPQVKDTLRQVEMVKKELANPNAPPVVSNVFDAAASAYRYNKEVGNGPWAYFNSIVAAQEKTHTVWKGSFVTLVPSDWRPYPAELFFKVYPSGRVSIIRENRRVARMQAPKFSFNNYIRHFQVAKVNPTGVTSIEDSNDWPVLMRLKSGEKVVREVTLASLVKTGLSDFRPRIARADKIVIRDGNVNWDKPTDKDPVLATITDPKEIAAFNRMFVFVEKSDKEEWDPRADIGLGCGCPGGPGIDWWKGGEKLAQTALHHGKTVWWDGFTWDFVLTKKSQKAIADWLSSHSISLDNAKR